MIFVLFLFVGCGFLRDSLCADVIDRLNALRGRGMTSLYSWSCKR